MDSFSAPSLPRNSSIFVDDVRTVWILFKNGAVKFNVEGG